MAKRVKVGELGNTSYYNKDGVIVDERDQKAPASIQRAYLGEPEAAPSGISALTEKLSATNTSKNVTDVLGSAIMSPIAVSTEKLQSLSQEQPTAAASTKVEDKNASIREAKLSKEIDKLIKTSEDIKKNSDKTVSLLDNLLKITKDDLEKNTELFERLIRSNDNIKIALQEKERKTSKGAAALTGEEGISTLGKGPPGTPPPSGGSRFTDALMGGAAALGLGAGAKKLLGSKPVVPSTSSIPSGIGPKSSVEAVKREHEARKIAEKGAKGGFLSKAGRVAKKAGKYGLLAALGGGIGEALFGQGEVGAVAGAAVPAGIDAYKALKNAQDIKAENAAELKIAEEADKARAAKEPKTRLSTILGPDGNPIEVSNVKPTVEEPPKPKTTIEKVKNYFGLGEKVTPPVAEPTPAPKVEPVVEPTPKTKTSSILGPDGKPMQVPEPTPAPVIEPTPAKAAGTVAEEAGMFSKAKGVLGKVGSATGAVLNKIATPLTVAMEGYESYEQYQAAEEAKQKGTISANDATAKKAQAVTGGVGGVAGALGGAAAGAQGGAAVGAGIGAFFGGVGAAPGAAIGGVIGGIGGGLLGAWGGRKIGEAVPGVVGIETDEERKKSKEALEKKMNEPQDTFSIGAVNYAKQKFDEAVPEFNRGTSGSLEAQNMPERVEKMMKEKGISYNEANKIVRAEIEAKDPNAFMMATNAISSKQDLNIKSTNRDKDYSKITETPTYDAMGNYTGPDIQTEYEKAGKTMDKTHNQGIVSNKSSFGSEALGALLSKEGLQTGSFVGTKHSEHEHTNLAGETDEKTLDIGNILGIRTSGGIFGSDTYEVIYDKTKLKASKSEYMRMQEYVANNEPERAIALFNELNKDNKKATKIEPVKTEDLKLEPIEGKVSDNAAPKSNASKWIRDLAAKNRVDPDDLEFGMNHPNIDVKADIAAGKAGVDTPEGIKAAMNPDIAPVENVKGAAMGQTSQEVAIDKSSAQPIIVNRGGDTVNNITNTSGGGSGGGNSGGGSPSKIPNPWEAQVFGRTWSAYP